MTTLEVSPGMMASPEVPFEVTTSPEVSFEMMAFPLETMEALTMMKLSSDVMLVGMPEAVFTKMSEMALLEMMIPAVFKMAEV